MIKTLHSETEFDAAASVVALGMFDGVHIGHQSLIRTAVQLAKEMNAQSIVCTFDRHPLELLCSQKAPKALLPLKENIAKIERLGADNVLITAFTQEFADMLPENFVRRLCERLHAKAIVIGDNYSFGKGGCGNAEMVKTLAKKYGYRAVVVPPVKDEQGLVSSTRIRALLQMGEIEAAEKLMRIQN